MATLPFRTEFCIGPEYEPDLRTKPPDKPDIALGAQPSGFHRWVPGEWTWKPRLKGWRWKSGHWEHHWQWNSIVPNDNALTVDPEDQVLLRCYLDGLIQRDVQ